MWMFYVCSYILTLCTACVWATSLLLSALSWQMPGEVRGRQPQSKHTHPVSLYPADGAGLQLCYLPLAFLSSTSSRVHYCAILKKKTICWCFTETAINLAEQQIRVLSSNIWKPCCLHRIILSFKQHGGPSHTTSVWGAVVSNPDRSSATWKSWSGFVEANYDPPPLPSLFYSRRLGEFSDVLRVLSGWKKEASSVIFYSPLL